MKISEIITEARRSPLRKSSRSSTPDMEYYDYLDNNNHPYMAYRFGIALAVAPKTHMYPEGPIGSRFTTIAYTDADNEIIDVAKKMIGVKSTALTSNDSTEMDFVNTQSPVKPKGPVKRKNP